MALIEINDLKLGYARKPVVHGISIKADEGEVVAIIGHNGAGKTTTLKGIIGLLKPLEGQVYFRGSSITGHSPMANVQDGLTLIPQEHAIFPSLSARENLEMGAFIVRSREDVEARLKTVHRLFPVLEERAGQRADTLSGGEQRMLSFGIAMMMRPQLLLLDEPSLGLSPLLVQTMLDAVREIRETLGTTVILVEQNVKQALRVADRAYVMKVGRIILEEGAGELLKRGQWWDLF